MQRTRLAHALFISCIFFQNIIMQQFASVEKHTHKIDYDTHGAMHAVCSPAAMPTYTIYSPDAQHVRNICTMRKVQANCSLSARHTQYIHQGQSIRKVCTICNVHVKYSPVVIHT
jgi:hypothetical protein